MTNLKDTTRDSWEYLMPKRKERMLGYIRESDTSLADSETIRSAAAAVRAYGEKEGYSYSPEHEYMEAVSAYLVPYMQRPVLQEALAACKRGEVDVFVITEIRAISRKQAEVFVIYDFLKKCNVRLETIQEKFEDSAIGRFILASRAFAAEVERENTYMRTQRGKRDRLKNGNLPGHGKAAYGYRFIDTDKETSARYVLNDTIIFVDADGNEWSEVTVVKFLFESVAVGISMGSLARTLTAMGIPTPGGNGKFWRTGTILRMLKNPMYAGKAIVNRFQKVAMKTTNPRAKNGSTKRLVSRSAEEYIHLPDGIVPAIVTQEVFDRVQEQLMLNKQDSLRNHRHPQELGVLRAGYCRCGICGQTMQVLYHNNRRKPEYRCQPRGNYTHQTSILVHLLDKIAWEQAIAVLKDPNMIRKRIAELRSENKPEINREDIEKHIDGVKQQIKNLVKFAQKATDDDVIETITVSLKELERQKREAESLLIDAEEDEEQRQVIETEIVRFEEWVAKVAPNLTDPTYTPTYEEMRLAVRIMNLHARIYPVEGYPHRVELGVAPPQIVAKLNNNHVASLLSDHRRPRAGACGAHGS